MIVLKYSYASHMICPVWEFPNAPALPAADRIKKDDSFFPYATRGLVCIDTFHHTQQSQPARELMRD